MHDVTCTYYVFCMVYFAMSTLFKRLHISEWVAWCLKYLSNDNVVAHRNNDASNVSNIINLDFFR